MVSTKKKITIGFLAPRRHLWLKDYSTPSKIDLHQLAKLLRERETSQTTQFNFNQTDKTRTISAGLLKSYLVDGSIEVDS
jgi:hypothetical protein